MGNDDLFEKVSLAMPLQGRPKITREAALLGSPTEKMQFIENLAIDFDDFLMGQKFIENMISRPQESQHAGGLWVLGDGGVGKSFLLKNLMEKYAPIDTPVSRISTLLGLTFDGTPSVSSIYISLLIQLGQDPELLHYKRNKELKDRLKAALLECGTRAIIFDEAHHLWRRARKSRSQGEYAGQVGNTLKVLFDETNVAFIFSGIPDLKEVYENDTQAKSRWSGVLNLSPFGLDNKYGGMLQAFDEALPFSKSSNLVDAKVAKGIFASTKGNFRLIKRLCADATYLAAIENSDCILLKHFAAAHFNIFCHVVDNPNPFV